MAPCRSELDATTLLGMIVKRRINAGSPVSRHLLQAAYLVQKICNLRIFSDADGKMNLSIQDIGGQFLVVSQFTLHAATRKGNRPSYIRAARPEQAIPLYEYFVAELQKLSASEVQTGRFGADMQVSLVNDGPVTIIMDSKGEI